MSDINKKVRDIMNNMDPNSVQKGMKKLSELMNSKEGKEIAGKLKNIDKTKLMKQLDKESISRKLDSVDPSKLSKQIENIDAKRILQQISKDPNIQKKFNDFLKDN